IEDRSVRRLWKNEHAKVLGSIECDLTARGELAGAVAFEAGRVEHAEDVGVSQTARACSSRRCFNCSDVTAVGVTVGVVDDEVAGASGSADAQDYISGHDAVCGVSRVAEVKRRRAEVVASIGRNARPEVK